MLNNRKKQFALGILIVALMFSLSACLPGDGSATWAETACFFWGIWHGWMAPVSLIFSLFNRTIRIYEVHNSGLGYDLGFYMAIISGFGGLSLARRKKNKD